MDMKKTINELKMTVDTYSQRIECNTEEINILKSILDEITIKYDRLLVQVKNMNEDNEIENTKKKIKKRNIRSYFIEEYMLDPERFNHVINPKIVASVFKNNANDITKRGNKDIEKFKATMVYNELVKSNNSIKKIISSMKENEEQLSIINTDKKNTVVDKTSDIEDEESIISEVEAYCSDTD